LAVGLKSEGLVGDSAFERIKSHRVRRDLKIDPEMPAQPHQRDRKSRLLAKGLSASYVILCMDAASQGLISHSRLAEALLCDSDELNDLLSLYGKSRNGN
jgi:hypothetical protein